MAETIALTGATGFVGGHVLTALLSAGFRVRALCRRPSALASRPGLAIINGALADREAITTLLVGTQTVVHCAGLVQATDRESYNAVNVAGTKALVDAASEADERPSFLLMSSMAARAPQVSLYGESKQAGEAVLTAGAPSLTWQILRPPAVYGPGDRATLPFFQQFEHGLLLAPAGGGHRFSLLYVEDLAQAVTAVVKQGLGPGRINELHDGMEGGYSWQDFAAGCRGETARRIRVLGLPAWPLSLFASMHCAWARARGRPPQVTPGKIKEIYHLDWVARENLLERESDWRPRTPLEEGFAKTLAWYKANRWL